MILGNARPVKPAAPKPMEKGMNIELENSTIALARDGLIALRGAEGARVTCLSGALWITEDQEVSDIILEAGESTTLRRPGLTLLMALQPASLRLTEQRATLVDRFTARLARWLPAGTRPELV
jgi:hypothetical protein